MKTQELLEKKLKKYSVKQLTGKLEKGNVSEVEVEIIVDILKKRGQDVSKWEMVSDDTNVEQPVIEEVTEKGILSTLKEEVDQFVDLLIQDRREGVYNEVMKVLGGTFESDLDELLEEATESQLKEALSFKTIKSSKEVKEVSKPITTEKVEKPKKEKAIKESKSSKSLNSSEVDFVKVGKKVSFLNKDTNCIGVVKSIFLSHKNSKEICKIQLEDNKIVHKRTNKLNNINE